MMETDPIQDRESSIFNSRLILFFVAVTLFLALLNRQLDLSLLSLLVLIIMGGAKVWSLLSLGRIACETKAKLKKVFAGETLVMTTTVANKKFLPVWVRLEWPSGRLALLGNGDGRDATREAGILWHQQARFQQVFTALRRGVFLAGPSRLQASDLFGFFRTEKKLPQTDTIVVYPRLVDVKTVDMPRRDLFGRPGGQHPIKDPVYITGTRDYQASSPARHIHWKASARHARLQEKVFEPSQQGKIMVALDVNGFSKRGLAEEFERTLEVIASLCLQIESRGMALGFATNGAGSGGRYALTHTIKGPQQVPVVLEALARVQMHPAKPLAAVMQQAVMPVRGISCLCFACELSPELERICRACRQRQIPLSVFVHQTGDASSTAEDPPRADVSLIRDLLAPGAVPA